MPACLKKKKKKVSAGLFTDTVLLPDLCRGVLQQLATQQLTRFYFRWYLRPARVFALDIKKHPLYLSWLLLKPVSVSCACVLYWSCCVVTLSVNAVEYLAKVMVNQRLSSGYHTSKVGCQRWACKIAGPIWKMGGSNKRYFLKQCEKSLGKATCFFQKNKNAFKKMWVNLLWKLANPQIPSGSIGLFAQHRLFYFHFLLVSY